MAPACKICAAASEEFSSVDFNKQGNPPVQHLFPPTGEPVTYYRCVACGFTFTTYFDTFDTAAFASRIYDAAYLLIDPPAARERPERSARVLRALFGEHGPARPVLDFGSGTGTMSRILREDGWSIEDYDPFLASTPPLRAHHYGFTFCSEVIEHSPDPFAFAERFLSTLHTQNGWGLLTTAVFPEDRTRWPAFTEWYLTPRNGHCSIYSRASLKQLWQKFGWQVESLNDEWHAIYRARPAALQSAEFTQVLAAIPTGFIPVS